MPWPPGQSGNPKGRPKGTNTLSYLLRQLGKQRAFPDSKEKTEYLEDGSQKVTPEDKRSRNKALAEILWDKAIEGDLKAIQIILSYAIGLPIRRDVDLIDAEAIKTYVGVSPDDWPGPTES